MQAAKRQSHNSVKPFDVHSDVWKEISLKQSAQAVGGTGSVDAEVDIAAQGLAVPMSAGSWKSLSWASVASNAGRAGERKGCCCTEGVMTAMLGLLARNARSEVPLKAGKVPEATSLCSSTQAGCTGGAGEGEGCDAADDSSEFVMGCLACINEKEVNATEVAAS